MVIELRPVSNENWYDCTKLNVRQEQNSVFPAPVVYALLVGFIVFCKTPDEDGNYWVPAFMIDENHQGNGYGKKAMEKLIELMHQNGCKRVLIGHRPHNLIAGKLYESLGFQKVSEEICDGEILRFLELD